MFAYSRRPGTPASKAAGQVSNKDKNARSHRMIASCETSRKAYMDAFLGENVEVLLETRQADGWTEGYTMNYLPVRVHMDDAAPGQLVRVRITGVEQDGCIGEPV